MNQYTHSRRSELVHEALAAHPDLPTRTIARYLHDTYPVIFESVERTRRVLRYSRGNSGVLNRERVTEGATGGQFMRPNQTPHDPWAKLAEGRKDLIWRPVPVPGEHILLLNDIHFPWHEAGPLRLALSTGEDAGTDSIVLNGDIADFYEASSFTRDMDMDDMKGALRMTWDFLMMLRARWPKAPILYKMGNHEERWLHWFWRQAPHFGGLKLKNVSYLFDHPSVFTDDPKEGEDLDAQAKTLKVTWIEERVPLSVGKLYILHGHELGKRNWSPVNAARGARLKSGESILIGHLHQPSSDSFTTLGDRALGAWSVGCLCNLHPRWSPVNPTWGHGFALIEQPTKGDFTVHNKKIVKGKVYAA